MFYPRAAFAALGISGGRSFGYAVAAHGFGLIKRFVSPAEKAVDIAIGLDEGSDADGGGEMEMWRMFLRYFLGCNGLPQALRCQVSM